MNNIENDFDITFKVKDITNEIVIFLIKEKLINQNLLKLPIDYNKFDILYEIDKILLTNIRNYKNGKLF